MPVCSLKKTEYNLKTPSLVYIRWPQRQEGDQSALGVLSVCPDVQSSPCHQLLWLSHSLTRSLSPFLLKTPGLFFPLKKHSSRTLLTLLALLSVLRRMAPEVVAETGFYDALTSSSLCAQLSSFRDESAFLLSLSDTPSTDSWVSAVCQPPPPLLSLTQWR